MASPDGGGWPLGVLAQVPVARSSVMAKFVIHCLNLTSQPTEELQDLLSLAMPLKWQ